MALQRGWILLLVLMAWTPVPAQGVWAWESVRAQLAQSLPLIGVDRVHQQLGITGSGVDVLIIDDWTINEEGLVHGQAVAEAVRAVAPGARLSFCKLDFSTTKEGDLTRCLTQMLRERPIRVVNLSFAVGENLFRQPCAWVDDALARAIRQLSRLGVIFVAAAGNDGMKGALRYPACLPEVISVGATYDLAGPVEFDTDQVFCRDQAAVDQVACYSNVADYLSLVAPGTVISTPSARNFGGTSAAAPLVSGIIALLLEADPWLSERQILSKLRSTAARAFDPATDEVYPRVDAYRAVRAAISGTSRERVTRFDANGNGVLDDSEFFAAVDEWIAHQISDELFFRVMDAWATQRRLLAVADRTEPSELARAERIQLFDLQGTPIAQLPGTAWQALRRSLPTLANGIYVYVAEFSQEGRRTQKMGKLVILK